MKVADLSLTAPNFLDRGQKAPEVERFCFQVERPWPVALRSIVRLYHGRKLRFPSG